MDWNVRECWNRVGAGAGCGRGRAVDKGRRRGAWEGCQNRAGESGGAQDLEEEEEEEEEEGNVMQRKAWALALSYTGSTSVAEAV